MKKTLLVFAMVLVAAYTMAQENKGKSWDVGGVATLKFSQTQLSTHWQAGGISAISVDGLLNLYANRNGEEIKEKVYKSKWENTLDLGYGILKQRGFPVIKSEDRIDFNSKYGLSINDNGKLFVSGLLNFKTQFDIGIEATEVTEEILTADSTTLTLTRLDTNTVSRFLAPAYLNFGLGLDYKPIDSKSDLRDISFSLYYSPVNSKVTIVRDDALVARYMPEKFALEGKNVRYELGTHLRLKLRVEFLKDKSFLKNLAFQTQLDLFSNYLEDFMSEIDVNWESLLSFKINNYITATLFTHLIYDDDIKFNIQDESGQVIGQGPRTQFKEVLGIGLTYKFARKKK